MGKKLAVAVLAAALLLPSWQEAAALENEDLLALVAMPLAVAAVAELTDVPVTELIDVVTLLNDAAVPPAQFLEVVRYAPAALVVENDDPDFVEFVRVRRQEGLTGTALVVSIEHQLRAYDLDVADLDVTRPRVIDINDDYVPRGVRTRVAEARSHPHGGPPGQMKKAIGVQTGAEAMRIADGDDRRVGKQRKPKKAGHDKEHGKGKGKGKG